MWKRLYHAFSGTLELCNRYYKEWSGASLVFSRVFLVLGAVFSFIIFFGLAVVFEPEWLNIPGEGYTLMGSIEHAVNLGFGILFMSAGILAGCIRPQLKNGRPFTSFESISKSIPGATWNLYLVAVLTVTVIYYFNQEISFNRFRPGEEESAGVFRNISASAFKPWLSNIADVTYSLLLCFFAGMLYFRTSRLPVSIIYRPAFFTLLVAGYACHLLIGSAYLVIYKLLLQPVLILTGNIWVNFTITTVVRAFIYVNAVLFVSFLVYRIFTQDEDVLDIGEE
ncbi:hypothetical protein EGT74_26120 [Chitinophaga lutea]|uniref:Uncharacterized protein n=1 Tax=Chitinophaga lutea TaxID=2488634 RepID=A0A3N4PLT6_9BACT|nr:hypothetical protein [Chitinophaga lutea]RPE05841.1 hypothetical protein EGT74_26120 [Chitinophaga lutea]